MNLERKVKSKPKRNRLLKAVLATAVSLGTLGTYLPLNLPTEDNTKPVSTSTTEGYLKPVALVGDDSKRTREKVGRYLEGKGYEVLLAPTIAKAKELIRGNPTIVKLVTDMDYAGSYDDAGFFERQITHRIDGFRLLDWLDREQKNGNYRNVEDITLHSTALNEGDLEGVCARPVTRYIVSRVGKMGSDGVSYRAQQKTAILGK